MVRERINVQVDRCSRKRKRNRLTRIQSKEMREERKDCRLKEVTRFPNEVVGRVAKVRWAFQDIRIPEDEVLPRNNKALTLLSALTVTKFPSRTRKAQYL